MRLVLLAFVASLAACTFPDVDYADGGAGGSCPGLDPCTTAAASCAASANGVYTDCTTQCHGGMGCIDKCGTDQTMALASCASACTGCAPAGCSAAASACKAASGM